MNSSSFLGDSMADSAAESQNGALNVLPRHVAIIMDGNARWAKDHGMTVVEGHLAGYANIDPVVKMLQRHGIEEATLFAFSTENWQRSEQEVEDIMGLASQAVEQDVERFDREDVRLCHIGSTERLSEAMLEKILAAVNVTARNQGFKLNLAFDYGGRQDIINATRRMLRDKVPAESVNEALFDSYLYTSGSQDPDLIIRTGGEFRISNFMLWQSAYSEFYSTETLWPAFGESELHGALRSYSKRQRRFGVRAV